MPGKGAGDWEVGSQFGLQAHAPRWLQIVCSWQHLPATGQTFGILVGQARAKALLDGARGQVLGGNQLQAATLAFFLVLDDGKEFRVVLGQGHVPRQGSGNGISHGGQIPGCN